MTTPIPVHVVWYKRDLRISDHAPLARASAAGHCIPLFVFEPDQWTQPEVDRTHFDFVTQSLRELDLNLTKLGGQLLVRTGDIVAVLEVLRHEFGSMSLHSHEETGGNWSYQRDRRVRAWCRQQGIVWTEYRQNGVTRGLKSRDRWSVLWQQFVTQPIADVPASVSMQPALQTEVFPDPDVLGVRGTSIPGAQFGGETHAGTVLDSFLQERGRNYRSAMSSPISAETSCSRISPYLAWGCMSIKQVHQRLQNRKLAIAAQVGDPQAVHRTQRDWSQSMSSFQSRLSWHCHFIQKLEDETELEHRNLCRVYDGLREDDFRNDYFEAWCTGQTGYPMIDACMRYLIAHRWINFRMRAMLISFAAYQLWLHWREPAVFLARHFLDFEPGIHYPQSQMQSGVTGINTIRIYSPVKQGKDQDPDGRFVRTWVPELQRIPLSLLFDPWRISLDDQARYGCQLGRDYPHPIVDPTESVRKAKERIYAIRETEFASRAAQQVFQKHGSRKRRDPIPKKSSIRPASQQQLWLPGMEDTSL